MMFGSSAKFLYDVPFSSDEEEEDDFYDDHAGHGHGEEGEEPYLAEHDAVVIREKKGKEKAREDEDLDELLARRLQFGDDGASNHLSSGAPVTEKVALAAFLTPKRPPQDGGKGKGGKKKKDPAEKRRVEAASLQAKFGDLFSVASCPAASTLAPPAAKGAGGGGRPRSRSRSKNKQQPSGDEASAIVEEWTLRLLAGVELLELGFKLPRAYPSVPVEVTARLSLNDKLVAKRGRKDKNTLKRLRNALPTCPLDHVVRERYPTFVDALRDLDDALSLVHLWATLPPSQKIHASRVRNCKRLAKEFQHFVTVSHSLRKSFLSIKGIYYQAEVQGQPLTWLVPYRFSNYVPKDVDYRVLEFYETLLGFVLFRLYSGLGLHYPPVADPATGAFPLPTATNETSPEEREDTDDTYSEENTAAKLESEARGASATEPTAQQSAYNDQRGKLFAGLHFWASRETPTESLEFVVKSFGGRISYEREDELSGSEDQSDASITHEIVDRPPEQLKTFANREYVQPQWVFDSANMCLLLPVHEYSPGATLPAHLSPFVNDEIEGYVPARREQLLALLKAQAPIVAAAGGDSSQRPLSEEEQLRAMEEEYMAKGKEKADDAASAATPTTLADNEAHAFAEELEEAQAQQKKAEIDRSLYDNSITSLLQEQANKGTRVPLLAEMARQWLELYESRMRALKQQKKAEARRKKEEEEKSRSALTDLRKPMPEMTNFQAWLLRIGLKKQEKPEYLETVDTEDVFDRKLAERKRKMKVRRVEKLWTLCIKAMGDSLLRYESLEGFPLQLRKEVLAYLVSELCLLYEEHLQIILDHEFDALDFSGLARHQSDNKIKDGHLKIVGDKCPRLKEINLTGAVKLKPAGFIEGLSKCHLLSKLIIDGCEKLNDDAMTSLIEGCPLLTLFSARHCRSITHATLYLLGRRCSDLSTVIVAGCTKIALEGVINLTRMSKRLQILDAAEVGNDHTTLSHYYVEPNRLSNQWLNSVNFDRCKGITNGFLRELFGPLPGQVCPNLASVSLRDCPFVLNGVIEEVILPVCPNLRELSYSVPKKAHGVSAIKLNGLSFLGGCTYSFPIRGVKLPPLLQAVRNDLANNAAAAATGTAGKAPISQAEVRRLVPNPTLFLKSVRQFDANVLARQAMRNLQSLTLGACGFSDSYNFLDFIISLPALRYLDVDNSAYSLKEVLFSCYYFLPHLETLICKRNEDRATVRKTAPYQESARFALREKQVKAKLMLDVQKELRLVEQQGEKADSAVKRKLWIVQHIDGNDKRYAPRLHTLNVSGHTFAGGDDFADLISNRCPELRNLSLANVSGIGERTLLHLLDQCVHMQSVNIFNLKPLTDHTVSSLRQKKPSLEINRWREA